MPAPSTLLPSPPTVPAFAPPRRSPWVGLIIAALALGLVGGFWILFQHLAPQSTLPGSAESAYVASFPEKSIAVLPLEDLTKEHAEPMLAEAVQDDILTALAKISELRVINRTSVSSYPAGQPRNLRTIAQSLGAGHILSGSVQRAGEVVHIKVELIDVRRASRLWRMSYDRQMMKTSPAQTEMVLRIAAQLQAEVTPEEKAGVDQRPTQDLVAYEYFVRGQSLLASVGNAQLKEKLQAAVETLQRSLVRQPDFSLAWCRLAAAHNYIYFFGFDHSTNRLAAAQEALNQAIRLRPNAGETHLARADFFYRCHLDYERARAELAIAERLLPNTSEAFELSGYVDRRQGLWAQSARSLQRAIKLDPRNSFILQQIAASYQEFRQFGAMAAALDRAHVIAPHDLDIMVSRAAVEIEARADTHPLQATITKLLADDPEGASDLADQWLYLSLCRRDFAETSRALAALPAGGTSIDLNFPRSFCVALAARARGDEAAARAAFLTARAEMEKVAQAQPDYGPVFTVLGLIDAGLGRKEEAMREGRLGVELLPIAKNSIDGGELMKYLGVIYAWCGEKDLAVAQIAATLKIPSSLSYGYLKLHPAWDALRGDPRFERIVADLAPKS